MDTVRKIDRATFSFWVLLMIVANLEAALMGDHVCQQEIIVPDVVPTWEPKKQTIRTYQWCLSIPPRCSVYSTRVENEFRISFINVTTSIETCCEGFKEENNVCVSMCGNCLNGLCSNSSCICRSGWDGPECEHPILPTELFTVGSPNASTEPTPNTQKEFSSLLPSARPTTPIDGLQQLVPVLPEDILDSMELPFNSASTSSMEYSDVELEGSGSTSRPTLAAEDAVKKLNDIDDQKENPSADTDIFQEETIVQSTPNSISVLMNPLAPPEHEEEKLIAKEAPMGQRYEKRASVENLTQNSRFSVIWASHQHLIYSICAATLISFVILVTVVTLYAMRASRKKIETSTKSGQEMATVALYTGSIFHSPLPDPPIFENPTYLAAISRDPNLNQLEAGLDAPRLSLSYHKQANHLKSDVLHYLYDHPPSTGSYRASSEVDTLSQYNFSQKYRPVSISEPVYDEIPSKVDEVEPRNGEPSNGSERSADFNCLYMNTCARAKF